MKLWKKFLLGLVLVVLLSQIPFGYRRYKLGRLHAAIQALDSERSITTPDSEFTEFKGVAHVHSFLGGHSSGNFEDIIAAAKSNQLDFVVMTEHTSNDFNTAAMTLKGSHAGIVFLNGNEVSATNSDRMLIIPGDETTGKTTKPSTLDILSNPGSQGSFAVVAYPQEFKSWDASGYHGVEVYNVYTNARQIRPFMMFFDGLWSLRSYPDLLFATFYRRPAENLKKWDEAISATGRKLVAVAGNDAHANIGASLIDSSGKTLLGLQLDPYERSFHLVRIHLLLPKDKALTAATLLETLSGGHCFIGYDLFGDTTGFRFTASNGTENKIQGDEIALQQEVRLFASSPLPSRMVLLKDGTPVQDESGLRVKEFVVREKGSYRLEVYLPQLPQPVSDQPWIISNPIYVR
ncbi:MAG TPA: hypothetical protein VMS31_23055 [Pyrinomonadaceae bacterium]|nr:hypothetical protein [Pyrinomonadaceae bacterium]